jgi:hypothetical protein
MLRYTYMTGVAILLTIYGCVQKEVKPFGLVAHEFITEYARLFPDETPLSIDNANLTNLHIPEDSILTAVKIFTTTYTVELKNYKLTELTPTVQKDYAKMQNILKSVEGYAQNSKNNPTCFNAAYGFQRILNANYAPAEKRLQVIFDKLEKVPPYYEAAKKQLASSNLALINENTNKHLVTFNFFKNTLPNAIKKQYHMTPQYQARLEAAAIAVKDYVAYVESLKLK